MQKGFASRTSGDKVFTWLYRKDQKEPKELNTINSLVSGYFYGKGEDGSDIEITEFERDLLSPLIISLRDGSFDFEKNSYDIAAAVAHLSIRPSLVRDGMKDLTTSYIDGVFPLLGQPGILKKVIDNVPDELLKDNFLSALSDPESYDLEKTAEILKTLGIDAKDASSRMLYIIRTATEDPEFKAICDAGIKDILDKVQESLNTEISEPIRKSHIQTIKRNVSPQPRIDALNGLFWSVVISTSPLILGDVPCIYISKKSNQFVSHCELDDIAVVFLPLSTNQVLIGEFERNTFIEVPENVNEIIARCSYDQFIAATRADELVSLMDLIGTNSMLVSESEIQEEIDLIIRRAKSYFGNDFLGL